MPLVRKEQERKGNGSERGEFSVGRTVNALSHTLAVTDQLHYAEATWLAGGGKSGLEMTFVRPNATREFVGLNLFGRQDVIGLKVVADRGKFAEERARVLARDQELAFMLRRQHANIVFLTPEELTDWLKFYRQIEAEGIYQRIGQRALDFSGLERITSERLKDTRATLARLLEENVDYLKECGVVKTKQVGPLDHAFLAEDGGLREAPLSWIKRNRLIGQVIEETVEDQTMVAGIMVPLEGESKREFNDRVLALGKAYHDQYGVKVTFAQASPGQVSMWRKLGFGRRRASSYPEAELTPGDLWRKLYLGTSNLEPGLLAQLGHLTLPGLGEEFSFPGIDLVFLKRSRRGVQEYAPIDGLAALDPRALKKGKFGVIPLDNVVGIKIVPDSYSWDDIKNDEEAQRRVRDAVYNMGIPGGHVLFLNSSLLQYWVNHGSPFVDKAHAAFVGDLQRAISYGRGSGSDEKELLFRLFRLKPEIGGDKKAITVRSKDTGDEVDTILDLGLSFNAMPEGFDGLGKSPGTADGLMRLLRYGILPMRPAWYAKEYLLQTVFNRDKRGRENAFWALTKPEAVAKDPAAQYLIQELFVRYTPEELAAKLPEKIAKAIAEQGPTYVATWRGNAQREVAGIAPTHAHADHDGLFPYATEAARVYAGAELIGFWNAKTMRATSWRNKLTYITLLSEPRNGSAYQIQPREIFPYYYSGKPVRITEGMTLWPYVCDHSLVSRMQVFEMNFNKAKTVLFNSGDWRIDRDGKTLRALMGTARHKPDIIVMETTNMGGNEKPGEGLTEENVRDTLLKLVKEGGNEAVIVVAPPNNLQRLYGLLEVAEATGRRLALSPSHAEVERQMMAARELAPVGADGFDWVLPTDFGYDNLTVWQKPMTAPRTHQEDLYEIAASGPLGILNAERLNEESEKWVVVISPYDILPDQFDRIYFPSGVRILYSAPFLYDWPARTLAGANLGSNSNWIRQAKAKVFMDMEIDGQGSGRVVSRRLFNDSPNGVMHVSGHPTAEQAVEALKLLVGPDRMKGVEIVHKLDRYDPVKPLKSGFALPITGGTGVKVVLNHGVNPERVAEYLRKKGFGRR